MGTHIKRCEGKSRFENEWIAGKAIETTLKWGRGIYTVERSISKKKGWLVGYFVFNGPLRQFLSLYRAVSQREGEREEKG